MLLGLPQQPTIRQDITHIGTGLLKAPGNLGQVERCKQTGRSPSLHRAMFRCWKGLLAREVLRAVIFSCLFVLTPFLLQQTIRDLADQYPQTESVAGYVPFQLWTVLGNDRCCGLLDMDVQPCILEM